MRVMRLLPLAFVLTFAAAGCVGQLTENDPPDNTAADAGTGNSAAKMFFDTNVDPLFSAARPKGACSVCHQGTNAADGPDFLGATTADNYATLKADTRLVSTSPTTSVLLLKGDHTGDALCTGVNTPYTGCTADEVSLISQWITMEAGN